LPDSSRRSGVVLVARARMPPFGFWLSDHSDAYPKSRKPRGDLRRPETLAQTKRFANALRRERHAATNVPPRKPAITPLRELCKDGLCFKGPCGAMGSVGFGEWSASWTQWWWWLRCQKRRRRMDSRSASTRVRRAGESKRSQVAHLWRAGAFWIRFSRVARAQPPGFPGV
jgi:hypothetical protein